MTIFDLRKRIAFVTGGNGGTGLGMAKGFASADASVVIAGRNREIDKQSRDLREGSISLVWLAGLQGSHSCADAKMNFLQL